MLLEQGKEISGEVGSVVDDFARRCERQHFAAAGIDGGMRAILESGKNIRVLAVDGTETVLRYMEEGRIAATVTQEPFAQGDEAVRVLFDYIHTGRRPAAGVVYTHNRVRVRHSQ